MCGITGLFYFKSTNRVDDALLSTMRDTMFHRGPDGGGNWISQDCRVGLAHRRLSIIDLSHSATQPMANEDGSVWVTFNGEIYNHTILRAELLKAGHRFATDHSDTEVLVHGYEQWGIEGLLQRLEGDYAIGLWDEVRGELFLVRDRIGVKPLYFSIQNDLLLFASEIKAITAHPDVERDVDPIAMYHYLSFLTTPAPMTMFKGIFKLPAGHYLKVSNTGKFEAVRYWDSMPGQGINPEELSGLDQEGREKYYINGIRTRLTQAVEKRMMSDVPFGVFLSGGVDSSTNVALMSQFMDRPVDTFTVGFKDYKHLNELEHADLVARKFNTRHHEVLIDEKDMVGYLHDLIHHQDEPIADWVCIPLYFVSKLTKDNGVTVIQVGEGSDEQFCGYASYMGYLDLYKKYWQPFRNYLPGFAQGGISALARGAAKLQPKYEMYADIIDRAARGREHFWSGATVFWDTLKNQLIRPGSIVAPRIPDEIIASGLIPESYLQPDTFNIIQSFTARMNHEHPGHDILARMIYNEFKLRLPELLLMRVDKITMSTSLEARVPFLDHKLVEFSLDIPMEYKTKGGEPKYLLKKAVEGLIPDEIIYRKKMGFGAPMSQWLKGGFGELVSHSILSSDLMKRDFFNVGYIESLIKAHRSGQRDCSLYIWTLFNLTAWYDYWVSGKNK
ncbi:asparagine synthase (glutamine-hydrolyzing) [Microvirgula aerodenitrificans]|uniref:asparagine synthase (glutamine-hydrolyzing) n=1 Tax=Microvirgula aerodenitrificans TaxID=57480 RepID=UPI002F426FE6